MILQVKTFSRSSDAMSFSDVADSIYLNDVMLQM